MGLILPAPNHLWLAPNCKQEKTKLPLINIDIWLVRDLHPNFFLFFISAVNLTTQHLFSFVTATVAGSTVEGTPPSQSRTSEAAKPRSERRRRKHRRRRQNKCCGSIYSEFMYACGYIHPELMCAYRIYLFEIQLCIPDIFIQNWWFELRIFLSIIHCLTCR